MNALRRIFDNILGNASDKIERGFGRNEGGLGEDGQTPDQAPETPARAKFEPKQPKIRRPGMGCIFQISPKKWEGSYSRNCQTANAKSLISTPTQEKNARKDSPRLSNKRMRKLMLRKNGSNQDKTHKTDIIKCRHGILWR